MRLEGWAWLGILWRGEGALGPFGEVFLVGWVVFGLMPFVGWFLFFLEKYLIRLCLKPCLHKNYVLVEVLKPPPLTVTPPIQMLLF